MTFFESCVKQMKPSSIKMIAEGKMGARLVTYPNGMQAVMKIASAQTTKNQRAEQRGFKAEELPRREVAFYKLAKLCGFDEVVPETVLHSFNDVEASFQRYVTGVKIYDLDPRLQMSAKRDEWPIALRQALRDKVQISDTARLTTLDFLACSRDRHAANYGARLDTSNGKARWRLVGWDNGCSFGLTQTRYHCVAHKHLFRYAFDLEPVWETLLNLRRSQLVSELGELLGEEAVDHVWHRSQFVLTFPHRMPWKTLSQGCDSPDSFPSYAEFFQPMVGTKPFYILQTQAM
jgi:hypothetical protein